MSGIKHIWGHPALYLGFMILGFAAGCGKDKEKVEVAPPKVIVAQVEKKTIPIYDLCSGNIDSVRSVQIIPRISGYIDNIYFKAGTVVKKGAPLYLIDPKPFKAKVDAVTAQLEYNKQKLKFAEIEANRYVLLFKENATSEEVMQNKVSIRDQLKATVAKNEADLEDAKLNLGYTSITAPFTGYIQKTNFYEGALVNRQQTVLTTLIQIDPMYINFSISRATGYKMQELKIENKLFPIDKIVISVYLPDGTLYPEAGKIDYMSFLINESTDCVKLRGIITNKCKDKDVYLLIPGQYVPIKMTYGELQGALLVPQAAVVESQVGAHVYVLGKDNKIVMRKVTPGNTVDAKIHIIEGLKDGESVVVQGVQKVKDGTVVDVVSEAKVAGVAQAPKAELPE